MVKMIFVGMVTALIIIPMIVSCAPGARTSPQAVADNQTFKPQASDVADNKTILKPAALPPHPEYLEKIVFWSLRDAMWQWDWAKGRNVLSGDNYEIYIMDPDGENQVNLTNNSDMDLIPSLSPDGKKILFVSDRKWDPDNKEDNNWDIFVMDVDGSNVKNLTGSLKWDSMPSWSPDGSMIVFISNHSNFSHIWVMDADGSRFLKIESVLWGPSWPSWSPDGKKILYNSIDDRGYSLWELEIDYDMVKQILFNQTPENFSGESWSSTGNRIVLKPAITASSISNPNENPLLKSVKKMTTQFTDWDGGASYSPDGSKIAYLSSRKDVKQDVYDLYIMNADGSNPTNITNAIAKPGGGAFNDWPSWSPDGKKISFVSDRDGRPLDFGIRFKDAWQIYTMNTDGSNVTRIVNNNLADGSPNWGQVPYDLAEKLKVSDLLALTIMPERTISALDLDQINEYLGKEVAIEGKVVEYGSSWDVETRPMLLFFDNPQQHCNSYDAWKQGQCGTDFRVIINIRDFKKFPDVFTYVDNNVRVVGKIDRYRGAPCIIATDPRQITIVK